MPLASPSGSPPNPAHRPGPDAATIAGVVPINGPPVLLGGLGHLLVDPDSDAARVRETMGGR